MKDGKFNGNCPAYPAQDEASNYAGLTKRELFAAMAMSALVTNAPNGASGNTICKEAVMCADALLAELERVK